MKDPFYRKAFRFRPVWTLVLGFLVLAASWGPAMAQTYNYCTVSTGNIDLGQYSSFEIAASSKQGSGSGGLACTAILSLLNSSYIKVKVDNASFTLTGGADNQTINFFLSTTENGTPIASGAEFDMSSLDILHLFSGPGGSLPLYVRTSAQAALKAGTYTGTVNLRWYFSVCTLGLVGICSFSNSTGFVRPGLFTTLDWGQGVATTVTVKMEVTNDCVIAAPNIDFGQAPFAANFNAVTGTILIRCSAGASYSVGLSNGNYYSGGWRRMNNATTGEYLQYDIYQTSTSTLRWGSSGAERRSSSTADTNPNVYDGVVNQGFTYKARINPSQTTPGVGTYKDTIILDVQF